MSRDFPDKRHLQTLSQHFCITVRVNTCRLKAIQRCPQDKRAFGSLKNKDTGSFIAHGGSPDCLKSSPGLRLNIGN